MQLWMMRGQIEEQQGNLEAARDVYNKAVSHLCLPNTLSVVLPLYL